MNLKYKILIYSLNEKYRYHDQIIIFYWHRKIPKLKPIKVKKKQQMSCTFAQNL